MRRGARAFADRLCGWQQKALREAKLESDWADVDEAYEEAARAFTLRLGAEAALPDLLDESAGASSVASRPPGAVNGLAQCLLEARRAGCARPLSGHGPLGLQPGRSRQSPAAVDFVLRVRR